MMIEGQKKEDSLQQRKLERRMLTEKLHGAIKELYAKGMPKKKIARFLEINVKTVRCHIDKKEWAPYPKESVASPLLDPYKAWVMGRMEEVGYNGHVLLRELRQKGYEWSYETLRRLLAPHRQEPGQGVCSV